MSETVAPSRSDSSSPSRAAVLRQLLHLSRPFRNLQAGFLAITVVQISLNAVLPILIAELINDIHEPFSNLTRLVVAILVILVLYRVVSLLGQYYLSITQLRLGISLQTQMLSSLSGSFLESWRWLTRGDILSRTMSDATAVAASAISWVLTLYGLLISIGISIAVLFILSPSITLVAVVMVPLFYAVVYATSRRVTEASRQERLAFARSTEELRVALENQLPIRALSAQGYVVGRFRTSLQAWFQRARRLTWLSTVTSNAGNFLLGVVPLGLFVFGLYLVNQGATTLGAAVAFFAYVPTLYQSVTGVTALYNTLNTIVPQVNRVNEVLVLPPETSSPNAPSRITPIEFRDVRVTAGPKVILSDITLRISSPITVVTGPNGAGKSTLLKLAAGLIQEYEGTITYSSIDQRSLSRAELRRRVVYVSPDDLFFSGSLRESLSLDRSAPDSDLVHWLEFVGMGALASHLNEPALPITGRLSSGERQRLSLARALSMHPELLLLDEALSSVEEEAEAALVRSVVSSAVPNVVIVSHRILLPIDGAEHVHLLDGRLVPSPLADYGDGSS